MKVRQKTQNQSLGYQPELNQNLGYAGLPFTIGSLLSCRVGVEAYAYKMWQPGMLLFIECWIPINLSFF